MPIIPHTLKNKCSHPSLFLIYNLLGYTTLRGCSEKATTEKAPHSQGSPDSSSRNALPGASQTILSSSRTQSGAEAAAVPGVPAASGRARRGSGEPALPQRPSAPAGAAAPPGTARRCRPARTQRPAPGGRRRCCLPVPPRCRRLVPGPAAARLAAAAALRPARHGRHPPSSAEGGRRAAAPPRAPRHRPGTAAARGSGSGMAAPRPAEGTPRAGRSARGGTTAL